MCNWISTHWEVPQVRTHLSPPIFWVVAASWELWLRFIPQVSNLDVDDWRLSIQLTADFKTVDWKWFKFSCCFFPPVCKWKFLNLGGLFELQLLLWGLFIYLYYYCVCICVCQVYVGMCTGTHACGDWCWMCPLIALCPLAERLGFSDSRFHILLLCTLVTGGPPCPPDICFLRFMYM